ncbi:DNA topoisomerase I [Candidatus Woesebacteria bacterium RIFCSPLOWO2_01_FULL_37_19]|uniref:DNA topoisomerase 1 n=2 Tax=Candidatus Woeseibacteriota TaxID=1752722 RepID=A0A1F8BCL9_9BACT|nr:MAG: DNA topoisomerase I [Candidatus Woesebacteria bacterium RIFCSPHIGHO2_01_FULL_38_26b]OGM61105.1 MAG: DNA topoisomerase I [Candidatus Woesebacteria bacterium RIFCSPLOWO2_01_FULL_37_19]
MNLIVVESPTKARTLSRFLGKDYVVEATMGHIKDLPKSELAVDVEKNFEPNYLIVEKKKDAIKKIEDASIKAANIYIATDPDREGEAIAQHVKEILTDNKQLITDHVSRIVFHEITQGAVEDAMKHPRKVDKNLVDAQIARRVLDRLVGYKLSPLLWKKVRRGLSAGRVQSVTVRLIVEREREIEAFKSVEYWEIYSIVKSLKLKVKSDFSVKLLKINGKTADVKNEKEAKTVVADLEKSGYKVFDVRKKEVRKNPYPPFTTSTMTQSGARLFGWSAKKTMNIAQRLYEEGLITYHRTDSVNLSTVAIEKAREYIDKNYGKNYVPQKPRFFKKTSKLVQEAHEAIRPTDVNSKFQISSSKFEKEGEILYNLIWKRFVACQVEASIFDETIIDVLATPKLPATSYLLRASGQVMKFDGWRKVIPLSKDEEPELPLVEKDEALDLIKVISEQKFTQPPPRYNEASLIKTLEKLGIGRPSTYAPIITTIQLRNYVEKNEGKFTPTAIGVAVNDFLVTNFKDIFDYSFTAEMENGLDDVAKGTLEWQKMMAEFYNPFDKKLVEVEDKAKRVKIEVEKLGKKCPTCESEGRVGNKQGELVIRVGRFGKFISCSLFPECKHTEKYVEKLNMKCPECKKGEVIVKTTKRGLSAGRQGKKFYGCSRYPKCKWASWRKPESDKERRAGKEIN